MVQTQPSNAQTLPRSGQPLRRRIQRIIETEDTGYGIQDTGLAMVQDQTLVASEHYLVETEDTEDYLVETKGKTEEGKDAKT